MYKNKLVIESTNSDNETTEALRNFVTWNGTYPDGDKWLSLISNKRLKVTIEYDYE